MKKSVVWPMLVGIALLSCQDVSAQPPDTLWTRNLGGLNGSSVLQTEDGGFIVAGSYPFQGLEANDVYLIKTNSSGDTIWTHIWGGLGDDWGSSVQKTSDDGYFIETVDF